MTPAPSSSRCSYTYDASASSTSWWMFVGLNCKHHPASNEIHDFEQRTMSTSARRATGAFSTDPSVVYIFDLTVSMFSKISMMFMIIMLVMVATVVNNYSTYMHIHIFITYLILFF